VCEGVAQIQPSTRPPRRRPRHRHRCCHCRLRRRRRRRCLAGPGRPLVNAALLPPSLPVGLPVPLTAPPHGPTCCISSFLRCRQTSWWLPVAAAPAAGRQRPGATGLAAGDSLFTYPASLIPLSLSPPLLPAPFPPPPVPAVILSSCRAVAWSWRRPRFAWCCWWGSSPHRRGPPRLLAAMSAPLDPYAAGIYRSSPSPTRQQRFFVTSGSLLCARLPAAWSDGERLLGGDAQCFIMTSQERVEYTSVWSSTDSAVKGQHPGGEDGGVHSSAAVPEMKQRQRGGVHGCEGRRKGTARGSPPSRLVQRTANTAAVTERDRHPAARGALCSGASGETPKQTSTR